MESEAKALRWFDPLEHARLAEQLKVSHMTIARVWRRHALAPHRVDGYLASNDPNFEAKAAEIIGLYLHSPQHAAVFCVDEKTAIQALDRKDAVLPLSPGRAERHGFEYYRHGTLSLYAAFNTKTGEVLGKTATRHTTAEFVAFLTDSPGMARAVELRFFAGLRGAGANENRVAPGQACPARRLAVIHGLTESGMTIRLTSLGLL